MQKLMLRKIWTFTKNYPLPLIAFLGLVLGIIFYFSHHREVSQWIWRATLVGAGFPIVFNTVKGMLRGHFASDIVAMLAIITALIMDQAFAGAVVVLMQSGGEAIEAYGLAKASTSLEALLARAPTHAVRKSGDQIETIDVKDVKIGDALLVRQGDLIPVDGLIAVGNGEIDESSLTGEPFAKTKTVGDKVYSGTINTNGTFEMRAEKISSMSQYAKIVDLVIKAQLEKAPIQRIADRYAILFTPLTLCMSGIGFLITRDPTTILAVLVVATPCPLILATPLAIMCGINESAKVGIIVKGGAPMEQVGQTEAAIFDKTGTITYGTPFVEEIVVFNHETKEELLSKAACIEQLSSHSVAKAVVKKALEGGDILSRPENFREFPGQGVEGDVEGSHFTIGSHAFIEQKLGKECFQKVTERASQEKVAIFVAKDRLCIGTILLSDKIRPNIPALLQKMRTLGVQEVLMLTGDSQKNAQIIAQAAGISHFKAELLPQQKVSFVQEIKNKYRCTTMIGDGINDAPALATATVGIALGAYGSAISAEAADIVLLVDDISKVGDAISISKRTLFIAKQSILIGIGLSFLLMCIAAFGVIQPAIGAMLQEVIDVAVILNALRVRS